jgi:predicted nucleic acid-binding protein
MMHAIDTQILLWAIKQSEPGREDLIARSVARFNDLKGRGITIMIPSIVVAEYLPAYPVEDHPAQLAILRKNFFIAPFDAAAAVVAAGIQCKRLLAETHDATSMGKHCLKADVKIIATAIAHGATMIYSHDKHFNSFGRGRILVSDVPDLPPPSQSQQVLFED